MIFLPEKLVETNHYGNLFIEKLVETNHFSNSFIEELVKIYTRGLTIDNLIEKRTNCNLSNQELIKEGTSDLLKKQLVDKVLVSPIPAHIYDVLVNLVTCVNFLRNVCPKSCVVFEVSPLFTMWL